VYAIVIALMAAQAIGRAAVRRDTASVGVAIGALCFMLSDSILAINKFAMPLPMSEFAVLTTYYAAQILIAHNAGADPGTTPQGSLNSSPALFGGVTPR
jgi:alkylglycerol monooxygenase